MTGDGSHVADRAATAALVARRDELLRERDRLVEQGRVLDSRPRPRSGIHLGRLAAGLVLGLVAGALTAFGVFLLLL